MPRRVGGEKRREDCVRLCEAPETKDAEEETEEGKAIPFLVH
jgi:hypothetical protein